MYCQKPIITNKYNIYVNKYKYLCSIKTIYYKYNKIKKNCSRIKLNYKNKNNYLKSK